MTLRYKVLPILFGFFPLTLKVVLGSWGRLFRQLKSAVVHSASLWERSSKSLDSHPVYESFLVMVATLSLMENTPLWALCIFNWPLSHQLLMPLTQPGMVA